MWSLGCIVVELFLGLPLFPGSSEYNQVSRITEMLGLPPTWMLEVGKQSGEFFEKVHDEFGRRTYRLKSMEQYSREHGTKEQPSKKYFQQTTLPDIIRSYPMPRKNMKPAEIERGLSVRPQNRQKADFDDIEMANRTAFIDFVRGLLNINPIERWSPQQAKLHPFITQQKFIGPFIPPANLRTGSSTRSPAPGLQQQQQAEALSKQRAQAAQAAHAQSAAQAAYANMQMTQYAQPPAQPPAMYSNTIYSPSHQGAPPPYQQTVGYAQQMPIMQQPPPAMPPAHYGNPQNSLYAQATTRAGRQRASTMEGGGIPSALQRIASHLDPNAPIRLQPSPAYYPPPPDGGATDASGSAQRRTSRAGARGRGSSNFVRTLEDRTLEEGFMSTSQWH